MRIRSLLSALMATLLVVSLSSDAFAKKGAEEEAASFTIEDTGVAKVDQFYDGVEGMVAKLTQAQTEMDEANAKLAEALGLAEGTPVADALADLQAKAEGKIELVLEGTKPTLKPADGCPENVQNAIDATNAMADSLVNAAETLKSVAADVQPMIGQAGDMPAAINESDLGLVDKGKALKTATANLSTTKKVAEEANTLAGKANESLELIKSTFGA
jgi:cell division septum initiation protein DivIVA